MNNNNAKKLINDILKSKSNIKIKLLGDSITHGVGGSGWQQNGEVIVTGWAQSPDSYCWANLLRDYMLEKYSATVVNKGCTGTKVEFIIDNFDSLVDDDDDIIICTIGTNNRHQYFVEGEKITPEEISHKFYVNVKRLYGMISDKRIPVIFVANIPASAENERDSDVYWRIIHMSDINNIYKQLEKDCGICLISLFDLFSKYCEEKNISVDSLLNDGLHPNDKGYKVMFDLLTDALGI